MNRKILAAAVALARKVADPRAQNPILACARLRGDVRGIGSSLAIEATDVDQWIMIRTERADEPGFNGDYIVPAHVLAAAIGKGPGDVALSAGAATLLVGGTTIPAPFALAEWPKQPAEVAAAPVAVAAEALRAALATVLPAAGRDSTRPSQYGVAWDGAQLVATDGHRLHARNGVPALSQKGSVVIPLPACNTLAAALVRADGDVLVRCVPYATPLGGTISFALRTRDGLRIDLHARLANADVLPWRMVVPRADDTPVQLRVAAAPLREALEAGRWFCRASGLAQPYVTLRETDGKLGLSAIAADRDKAEFAATVAGSITPGLLTAANTRYLLDALDALDARGSTRVEIRQHPKDPERDYGGPGSVEPMLVQLGAGSDDDGAVTVVVMPSRV